MKQIIKQKIFRMYVNLRCDVRDYLYNEAKRYSFVDIKDDSKDDVKIKKICTFKNGLYVIWKKDKMIYVGESNNVPKRTKKILSRKHEIYTKVGSSLFTNPEYSISFVDLELGRKEIEEDLIYFDKPKYNAKSKSTFKQIYKDLKK